VAEPTGEPVPTGAGTGHTSHVVTGRRGTRRRGRATE